MAFVKATRKQINLRLAFCGPTGSGKTYSALLLAEYLAKKENKRIGVIDSEKGSAEKYADRFDFDHLILKTFEPEKYIEAIKEAAKDGYILVIDSLSHAWEGKGGMLDQVDAIGKRQKIQNSFTAWREGTPMQNAFVDAMLDYPGHLIATMRVKMEHIIEKDGQGKTQVRKVGLRPVQRDGLEYEFDLVGDIDQDHILCVTKTRCSPLVDYVEKKPGEAFASILYDWLIKGEPRKKATQLLISDEARQIANAGYAAELEAFENEVKSRDSIADISPLFKTLPQGKNRSAAMIVLARRCIVLTQSQAELDKLGKWMQSQVLNGFTFGESVNDEYAQRSATFAEDVNKELEQTFAS